MPEPGDGRLILGRYTREECGLPPDGSGPSGPGAAVLKWLTVLAAMLLSGWLAGLFTARTRELWLAELPARVAASSPAEAASLLALGRVYALALPERSSLSANLALALVWAGERFPRPAGFYGNAANLLAVTGDREDPEPKSSFFFALAAAGVFAEVEDYRKAFASLDRAAKALEAVEEGEWRRRREIVFLNSRAYLLATAPGGTGRDHELALGLIRTALASREKLPDGSRPSESAAILDTLAAAWRAAGDFSRAGEAQALALGLAETDGLAGYLRRHDQISAAGGE
ncbi:MAG: hypothetical protein LBU64_08745 [Planctomycetota bacterium]|jgi:hypothetical protein|nr:hypothetical protein [Planctomycetota bacterium]